MKDKSEASSLGILHTWANMAVMPGHWSAVEAIVAAADRCSSLYAEDVDRLLRESDTRLRPLEDPLHAGIGLNRWLRSQREESYSDWLHWVLEQIKEAHQVFSLFWEATDPFPSGLESSSVSVHREFRVPGGRLDILIRFGAEHMGVVEVKTVNPDYADTEKHRIYLNWSGSDRKTCLPPILLAPAGMKSDYHGFRAFTWEELCTRLRRMLPRLIGSIGITKAAMVCAFIGAVEENILNLSLPGSHNRAERLLLRETRDYLSRTLHTSKRRIRYGEEL